MYQPQYGLQRRPFSATPDPTCVISVGGSFEALSKLERCAEDGQGIGLLTAPAGLGKTVLCRKLAERLRDQFAVVFLPNANFPTRRSLLQAILYEMGHPYLRLGEQELRLELMTAVRDLFPDRLGLVLIVDEAHLLHNRLLEELRTCTHLVQGDEMLVRLILSGQLELEERLAAKTFTALNQRIVCHGTLDLLTLSESETYLSQRMEWAGGSLADTFTSEAVRKICQASDGNVRCLNQLADHCLLLGEAAQESRISSATVLEALDELRELPLQWNAVEENWRESAAFLEAGSEWAPAAAADPAPLADTSRSSCIEFGGPEEEPAFEEDREEELALSDDDFPFEESPNVSAWERSISADDKTPALSLTEEAPIMGTTDWKQWPQAEGAVSEERIIDHYARLDQGQAGRAGGVSPPVTGNQKTVRNVLGTDQGADAPRSPETRCPLEELRAEEAAFAVPPPSPRQPEITVIHSIPHPEDEWQPESLRPFAMPWASSDPSRGIDQLLPLLEAAQRQPAFDLLNTLSAETTPVQEGPPSQAQTDQSSVWTVVSNATESYVDYGDPWGDLESQIARTVLDTYSDLRALMGESRSDSQKPKAPHAAPLPRGAGEEPIREPGDSTPFDQLRDSLQQAVEATQPLPDPRTCPPAKPPVAHVPVQFDVVLPDSEDDESTTQPTSSRTDAPSAWDLPTRSGQRPYKNLFSQIRRKEQ